MNKVCFNLTAVLQGCSSYNGLYGEVWLPLEKDIFLFRLQVRMGGDFSSRSILKSTENQKG